MKPKESRWVAVFDSHGDKIEESVSKVSLDFIWNHWKPTRRIHGGDAFDFRWLRSKASDDERLEDTKADFEAGKEYLSRLKPTDFMIGNHDKRLWRLLDSHHGERRALGALMVEEIIKLLGDAKVYPYHKSKGVLKIGDVSFLHGMFCGVNAAKRTAEYVNGNVIFGHTHAIDCHSIPMVNGRIWGRNAGCLCSLDMEYADEKPGTMRWSNGFSYGITLPSGKNLVYQAEAVDGKWYFPTEMRAM
jgi:hypothetical protein